MWQKQRKKNINLKIHTRIHSTKCRYHKDARSTAGKNNNTAHVASWPTATHHDSINCRDHRLKDVHRHNRRRHRHQDNNDYDCGHRNGDDDDNERNVQEKLCTGLHWAVYTGLHWVALVCTGLHWAGPAIIIICNLSWNTTSSQISPNNFKSSRTTMKIITIVLKVLKHDQPFN